jgi:hypothetical protein
MLRAIDGKWEKAEIILARFFFGSFLFIDWKRNESLYKFYIKVTECGTAANTAYK